MGTTLFTNGSLFDGHRYLGAGEVLVDGERMVAVGQGSLNASADRTVDLAGGLLLPGFIDAHVHAVQGGLERLRCDLSSGSSKDDYLATIKAYADAHPHELWILGGGWAMAQFPGGTPTAAELDVVVADRPVFLPNRDHHGAWVNSVALDLAGITNRTPDPSDGRIERDGAGQPTGTLHEGAMGLVSTLIPDTSEDDTYAALLEGQEYLHACGVTGWQDAIIGNYSGMGDAGPTYLRAAQRGDLTATVTGALWWDRSAGAEQIALLLERRREFTHGRFSATTVKIMQDGVAENFSAALTSPYLDRCGHLTDNSGDSFVNAAALKTYAGRLDAEGFQIHVHAIGDRGVREALDALTGLDHAHRHHIAHLQVVHPDDVGRFAGSGLTANMQMLWACHDDQMVELTMPFLGPERATWQYPFGALAASGAYLCAGSDWPVSSPNPLEAIHVGVNRTAYGQPGRAGNDPFLPGQALSIEAAFAAYTSGSARINHRDDAGVLQVGAVADLVVLAQDPFAGPREDIGGCAVRSTWVDGAEVYSA